MKKDVITGISKAVSVALTTDGWTSRATESYITTAHYISQDWKLENKVLETTTLPCSHTGETLGEALNDTATRWNTKRQHGVNCVVTDNASNITLGVKLSGLQPHVGCFAHTINLATKSASWPCEKSSVVLSSKSQSLSCLKREACFVEN